MTATLPRQTRRQRARQSALGLCLALAPVLAWSHPHAWIDVHSTIVLSAQGAATAIEQTWLFDELYSSAVLEENAKDGPAGQDAVDGFAAKVIENLGPYGYFTRVTVDGQAVELDTATEYHSEMKGGQLQLTFKAPLPQAVDLARHTLQFAVFDPTFFIQMSQLPDTPPAIQAEGSHTCRTWVEAANPSPKVIARAMALDANADAQDDLGILFAEKVHIQCR